MLEAYHADQAEAVRMNVAADSDLPDIRTTRFDVVGDPAIAVSAFSDNSETRED
jgi:hypothetical protein